LHSYNSVIQHRTYKSNVVADALRRGRHLLITIRNEIIGFDVMEEDPNDAYFGRILQLLTTNSTQLEALLKTIFCGWIFVQRQTIMYSSWISERKNDPRIAFKLLGGHFGRDISFSLVHKRFFWQQMRKERC
jgi:hypothetical protein